MADVRNRSFSRTGECFLSSPLCKVGIMLAKGKAPKVSAAAARREPVTDSPEGRRGFDPASQGP